MDTNDEKRKMNASRLCSHCGAPLPVHAPGARCPRCLLQFALDPAAAEAGVAPDPAHAHLHYFGDYELVSVIARGGMGVVYKARQVSLNRVVAVKMLLAGQFSSDEYVRRFRTEAEAAATLRHPNIVAIHEVGEHDGRQYFSMEYVKGQNLAALVHDQPLPAKRAARLVQSIAEAIYYAHQRGVIHRDLKPSNVLLDEDDQPRVTDFGLAKFVAGDDQTVAVTNGKVGRWHSRTAAKNNPAVSQLTVTGQVLGTPGFMPPEQAGGRRGAVTKSSDVYSLGAILYFLLTARAPFAADSLEATLRQVLENDPVAPRLLNAGIPRDLETICLKCLEKAPQQRFASAQELADELGRFLEGKPICARPVSAPEKLWRWCRRHPLVASLAVALQVALALGLTGVLWQSSRATRSAAAARFAQQETTTNLWHSYLAQARANRFSGRPGRRFDSLDVLAKAAAIRPAPELRDEVIAALAHVDLREVKRACADLPDFTSSIADAALQRYAAALPDGAISVRRRLDDVELLRLPPAAIALNRVLSFSHDGRLLAAQYANNGLRVYDLEQRRLLATGRCADMLSTAGSSLNFRPDDVELATTDAADEVVLINLTNGVQRKLSLPARAQVVRYNPTGDLLAVGFWNSTNVVVLNAASGNIVKQFASGVPVRVLAWHPDGTRLAVNDTARRLTIWDWRSGEATRTLAGHNEDVTSLAFHPNGRLLLSSGWEGVFVWDHQSGEWLLTLPGSAGALRLAADGTGVFKRCPLKAELAWCEMTDDRPVRRLGRASLGEANYPANAASFSPGGDWLVSAREGRLFIDEVRTGHRLAEAKAGSVDALAIDAATNLWTSGRQGLARRRLSWDANATEWVLQAPESFGDGRPQFGLILSRDGRTLASISSDYQVQIRNALSGEELARIPFGADQVRYLSFSPDGDWLATGTWDQAGAQIWETRTGRFLRRVGADTPMPKGGYPAFSADNRWLFIVYRDTISAWRTDTWELAWSAPKEDHLMVVGVAPDASVIAVRHDKNVFHLLTPESGTRLATIESPNGDHITGLFFSPDSTRLCMQGARSHELFVWDLREVRKELSALKLDWDRSPYSPENKLTPLPAPLRFRIEPKVGTVE